MIFRRRRKHEREHESERERETLEGTTPTEPGPVQTGDPEPGEAPTDRTGEPSEPAGEKPSGIIAQTRAALAPVKKRHIVIATAGAMGFLLAATILFAGVSFWWTSQPSFCARCHVMEPYITAWEQSSHRDVNCESCHLTPGFFGFVGGKIAGLQVVANYIRGDYEDWSFNAAVSNASCLQCHEEIVNANIHSEETGVTVSHLDILETGGKCMFCHSTVAHGSAVPVGSSTHPTMAACLKCHNDQTAPLDCGLCHVGKQRSSEKATTNDGGG